MFFRLKKTKLYNAVPQLQLSNIARVEKSIYPGEEGQVFFKGTYWQAKFYNQNCKIIAYKGQKVKVMEGDRLPLLVMPVEF